MKKLLRHFVIDTSALYLVSYATQGLVFENGIKTIVFAGAALTVASLLAKPIINLLLLPINLITFNLFKWVSSAIALYLVTLVVPGFKILGFVFSGFSSSWVFIPPINLGGVLAFVAYSFVLAVTTSIVYWIIS